MADTATPLQQATSADTDFLAQHFFVLSRLLKMQTATLVRVVAVYPPSGSLVGKVDVLPLVNQVDGAGNTVPHVTLYGRPYSRVQGGSNAVICDPAVGDIGVMVFGSRDLSSVIASGNPSPPASGRYFDRADGLYLYSLAKGAPTQYIEFTDSGINIVSPTAINLQAPNITLTGAVNANGATISEAGEVTDAAGKVLGTHTHTGVTSGGSNTGPPT